MPRGGFRGRGFRTVRSRRKTEWFSATLADGTFRTVAADTTDSLYIVLPSTLKSFFTDPTIVRVRGQFYYAGLAAGRIQGAVGIIKWSDINDTAPAGSDVQPWSAPSQDFLWWHGLGAINSTSQGDRTDNLESCGPIEVDSRAMRKMGQDSGILLVVENRSTISIGFDFALRILVKE